MFAETLQGAMGLGPSGSQLGTDPRVAMIFTSRMRSAVDGPVFSHLVDHYKMTPGGWLMSSVAMSVNPKSVKFTQTKRITKKDTREGSVYFHFTNSKGQNNDILVMNFSGSTGNIDLRGSLGTSGITGLPPAGGPEVDTGALKKLQVWQNLFLLTREPMLLRDNAENIFTVEYRSKLFPLGISFNGFYSKVMEYEETGEKPNSRTYSFDFTVTSTNPPLDELLADMAITMSAQAPAQYGPSEITGVVTPTLLEPV